MKATQRYWLDITMGLLATVVALSAFLLWVVLPQGYFPSRLFWVQIHKWMGLALGVTALLHVMLHRKWLMQMTRRRLRRASRGGFRAESPSQAFKDQRG